jgi:hypothetical protein
VTDQGKPGYPPSPEAIERAWVKKREPPSPGMRAYNRAIFALVQFVFALMLIVVLGLVVLAFADKVMGLGWGAHWIDVWGGLGMAVFVVLLYLICRAMFRFFGG